MLAMLQNRESGRQFEAAKNLVININPGIGNVGSVGAESGVIEVRVNGYGIDMNVGRNGLTAFKFLARSAEEGEEKAAKQSEGKCFLHDNDFYW